MYCRFPSRSRLSTARRVLLLATLVGAPLAAGCGADCTGQFVPHCPGPGGAECVNGAWRCFLYDLSASAGADMSRIPCGGAICSSGQVCITPCCAVDAGTCPPKVCGTLASPTLPGCAYLKQNCCDPVSPPLGQCDSTCFASISNGEASCHCGP